MNTIQLSDNINNIYPLPIIPKKKTTIDGYEYEEEDCNSKEYLFHSFCIGNDFFNFEPNGKFDKRFDKQRLETIIAHRYKHFVKMRNGNYVVCANEELQKAFGAAADWLIEPQGKSSLLLYGKTGSGKSTMLGVIRTILTPNPYNSNEYKKPKFFTAYDIAHIKKEDWWQLSCERLFIDDLGTEELKNAVYGVSYCPMIELLSERYDRQAATIITSNLTLDHIKEKYGERIADRIREEYKIIGFNNDSYRGSTQRIPDDEEDCFCRSWKWNGAYDSSTY